mgnify:CR=1 FL=1
MDKILIKPEAGDAVLSVYLAWRRLNTAGGHPVNEAQAMLQLADAIHDLSTWLPGYNSNTGLVEIAED